jgi:hypothetical protein
MRLCRSIEYVVARKANYMSYLFHFEILQKPSCLFFALNIVVVFFHTVKFTKILAKSRVNKEC